MNNNKISTKKNGLSRRTLLKGGVSAIALGGVATAAAATTGCANTGTQEIMNVKSRLNMDRFEYKFSVIDAHTVGEFCRVVLDGFPTPQGNTMIEKKKWMEKNYDFLRTALMFEPRGHHDMFGAFLCEPVNDEADCGVLFMDTGGYLNMCGHCSIGSATVLFEAGYKEMKEGENEIVIEAPAGLIRARAQAHDGKITEVSIKNVPSFVYKENQSVVIDGQTIPFDICFGGSFFALVEAAKIGITDLTTKSSSMLSELGNKIRKEINKTISVKHPTLDIDTVDLVEFYGPTDDKDIADLRNVVVFGDSQVDRSPCGTGTSAKLAWLHKKGLIKQDEEFRYESIIGTVFKGKVVDTAKVGDYDAVVPEITGSCYITGFGDYLIDPTDPLKYGFELNPGEK